MAQTTFNLAVEKIDTPLTDGSPSTEKTSSGNSKTGAGNQGFLTQDGAISKDVIGVVSSPIVSGAFIFAGIILLLALVAKLKKNKHSNFKDSLTRKHYTTRILGFASFLMLAAGLGGTVSRFMGVTADTNEDGIITSGIVNASLVEIGEDYKLYCGEDQLRISQDIAPYGNIVFMKPEGDSILTSHSSGITDINTTENWENLAIGEWGYYAGSLADFATATKNPMPINYSVVSNEVKETKDAPVPITYCAKVSKNIETANFSAILNYEMAPKEEYDLYPSIDFNSPDDDDSDGISNREENRYGMNPLSADSDMDSLSDYDELKVHHTDPLLEDTDEDGLYDYSEIALAKSSGYNTDPLNPHSFDPEKLDSDESYVYGYTGEQNGIKYNVVGTGNIPITYIDVVNPTDVNESLELEGTAYVVQSAGEVQGGEMMIPYLKEDEVEEEVLGETFSGIDVTDDNISEEDLYAISLTYDIPEDAEDGDEIPINSANAEIQDIDTEDQTITIGLSSNQEILIVGDEANDADNSDLISDLGENSSGWLKTVYTTIKQKIHDAWDYTWSYIKSAFASIGHSHSGSGNGGADTWEVSSNFQMGRDSFDMENKYGYYDESEKKFYGIGGLCHGMALLARLLYKDLIDLNMPEHTIGDRFEDFDNTFSFCTSENSCYSKDEILHTKAQWVWGGTDLDIIPGYYPTGAIGEALFKLTLFGSQKISHVYSSEYFGQDNRIEDDPKYIEVNPLWNDYLGPDKFIDQIKFKVDKNNVDKGGDDPIVFNIRNRNNSTIIDTRAGHSVNLYSIKRVSTIKKETRKFELGVYDNNFPSSTLLSRMPWIMECSKVVCTVTTSTTVHGNPAPYFEYMATNDMNPYGDEYFLYR